VEILSSFLDVLTRSAMILGFFLDTLTRLREEDPRGVFVDRSSVGLAEDLRCSSVILGRPKRKNPWGIRR